MESGSLLTGGRSDQAVFVRAITTLNGTVNTNHPVDVRNGGLLYGTGTINQDLDVGFVGDGKLAPGEENEVGTLTVNGDVAFGVNSIFELQLGNTSGDLLAIDGDLTIDADATLVAVPDYFATPSGDYTVVTYTGARSGTFDELYVPDGYTVDYSVAGSVILRAPTSVAAEPNIVFPAKANVLDVTAQSYWPAGWAANQATTDVTAALNQAIDSVAEGNRIVYLPNGTYLVSDSVVWGGTQKSEVTLQGQSESGTTIKLANSATGYGSAASPKTVVDTLDAGAAIAFRNRVSNLTINTGTGNPGAVGLKFKANNQGSIQDVTIVSEDGTGAIGLDLSYPQVGPLLVKDVRVVGFDLGINASDDRNGLVFEDISLEYQNFRAFENGGQPVSMRDLLAFGNVSNNLVRNGNTHATIGRGGGLTLVDATLIGIGAIQDDFAISSAGLFFGRNIATSGFETAFRGLNWANGNFRLTGPFLDEFAFIGVFDQDDDMWVKGDASSTTDPVLTELAGAVEGSLDLPFVATPEPTWESNFSNWASPLDFGAVANDCNADNTAAIQAAIDSGATTVVIPGGQYFRFTGTVYLRGDVERFLGTDGRLEGTGKIVVLDGTSDTVVIERFRRPVGAIGGPGCPPNSTEVPLEVRTTRNVVVSSLQGLSVEVTVPGNVFIEDVTTDVDLLSPSLHAWVKHLNIEGGESLEIAGASVNLLGYKTEDPGTKVIVRNGGVLEMLGAHIFSNADSSGSTIFDVTESQVSLAGIIETSGTIATQFGDWVDQTRNGVNSVLTNSEVVDRTTGNGRYMALYSGHFGDMDPFHYETGGRIEFEAEHFDALLGGVGSWANVPWDPQSSLEAQNLNALFPEPIDSLSFSTGDTKNGSRLDYMIDFATSGTYYVWLKLKRVGPTDATRGIHAGLTSSTPATYAPSGIGVDEEGAFEWVSNIVNRTTISIPSAGEYSFSIWMKDDDVAVDAVILTDDINELLPPDEEDDD